MENLEILKLELLSQKTEIENKGGVVHIANTNPSPSEITAGIKTISVPDFTSANATVEDVVSGKTFYAGNSSIKVGTKVVPDLTVATALEDDVLLGKTFFSGDNTLKTGTKQIADLSNATATEQDVLSGKTFYAGNQELKVGTGVNNSVMYTKLFISNDSTGDEQFYFTIPPEVKILKSYLLYTCPQKKIEITFNSDLEEIGDYAFSGCKQLSFTNFSSLTKLNKIGQYAFSNQTNCPLDLSNLPTSTTVYGLRSFNNSIRPNSDIVVHSALKECGTYVFAISSKTEMNTLTIADDIALTTLPGYMFENLIFNCDFRVPSTVTALAASFAYGCSFNNITIPATCVKIGNGAFYASKTEAASYRRLQTVTFESETPPTFGTYSFADQDKINGFKIYVPDNAVDTYKADAKLATFVDYIFPVSQKP